MPHVLWNPKVHYRVHNSPRLFPTLSQKTPVHTHTPYLFKFCLKIIRAVIAQSVQRWATGWTIGVLGFDSQRGLGIFIFTTASRTALGTTQPPIQWVPGALSLEVKQPGFEADHSPPSSAEVKECVELYLHSPIRLHGVLLS
jgi:hypothetical protein